MTCLEHYFENLLIDGEDAYGGANRKCLTEEERKAVETCADYVIYVLFGSREEFEKWRKRGTSPCEKCQEFDCYGCEVRRNGEE